MGGFGVRVLRYTGIEGRLADEGAWSLALGGEMTSGTGKNKIISAHDRVNCMEIPGGGGGTAIYWLYRYLPR